MAGSENTTAFPFARLPRETIEAIIEAALTELDAREGDPDLEPEEDRCATHDDDPKAQLHDAWPGDAEDAEEDHDREYDPAEYETWVTPEWHVSAALSPVTPLFQRSAPA